MLKPRMRRREEPKSWNSAFFQALGHNGKIQAILGGQEIGLTR
jgi:hypothetical protein